MQLYEQVSPFLKNYIPYQSARSLARSSTIKLDANELAFDFWGGKINSYPDSLDKSLNPLFSNLYGVKEDSLIVDRGIDELLRLFFKTFSGDKKKILTFSPTFGMYDILAKQEEIENVQLKRNKDGYIPFRDLNKLDFKDFSFIILCRPNNPLGVSDSKEQILSLLEATLGNTLVLIDEAYIEFSGDKSFCQYLNKYPNLVIMRTLSKAYGLAGLRVGCCMASSDIISYLKKVQAPYPIPSLAIEFLTKTFSKTPKNFFYKEWEDVKNRKKELATFLSGKKEVEYIYDSEANFITYRSSFGENHYNELLSKGFQTRLFSLEDGFINRISIGSRDQMNLLQKALDEVVL